MSVIVEFRVPASDFELGRILDVEGMSSVELERLVPVGGVTVPLVWIHNSTRKHFVEQVRKHPAVDDASAVDDFEDQTLFTLKWDTSRDSVFEGLKHNEGQLLSAVGTAEEWDFEARFRDHDALSAFTRHCEDAQVRIRLTRVYNPTQPETGPWYNLTDPQREALVLAVESGYYDIPRGCTTKELAAELGISDQAVTERLRRAITTLVTNALLSFDDTG